MFLVLVKKGKIRVWMIVSKESGVGQKSATSKKKLNFQANTISDLGLLTWTNYRWSSTLRFIKAIFNFANLKIQTLFASYGVKEAFSPGKPSTRYLR